MNPRALTAALPQALTKLDPRHVVRSPVIFVVWVGSLLTTVLAVVNPSVFAIGVAVWLWVTVVFANLAEAVAEGRGKAQAASLRATRTQTMARRLVGSDPTGTREEQVPGAQLRLGDLVVVEAGQVIPGDGDIVDGLASVDESAITGESAPVIRESGGDRSAVTGGTTVLSDRIVVKITAKPGETFIDRMIALVEGAARQKTPNEIALNILLATLTIIFLLVVMALQPMAAYSGGLQQVVVLVALLVCLIPTTIGALLSAIGIAGMDRLVQRNVLAMSGPGRRGRRRRVDPAPRQDRHHHPRQPPCRGAHPRRRRRSGGAARRPPTSAASPTRRRKAGRSSSSPPRGSARRGTRTPLQLTQAGATFVEFTAQTRMSGVDLSRGPREVSERSGELRGVTDGTLVRKGAGSQVRRVDEVAGRVGA